MSSVALCVVAGGAIYDRYADDLFESATWFFRPSRTIELVKIKGDEGWPNGTMMRWHHLLEQMPDTDYVFMTDADMRFEQKVGSEILDQIVTTQHPGYVGKPWNMLPFEYREHAACYVPPERRIEYYCGGFVGGDRSSMTGLAKQITSLIDLDQEMGVVPIWHDESALNHVMSVCWFQRKVLSPAYCHPDNDSYYRAFVWAEDYPRILVALDKSKEERGER